MKPLTEERMFEIINRLEHCDEERRVDTLALVAEIERLSDQLSDCWLLLDKIARLKVPPGKDDLINALLKRCGEAGILLKSQKALGWKS